jgi:hypothetical protein
MKYFVLTILLGLLASGCQVGHGNAKMQPQQASNLDFKTYTSTRLGITFEYPASYTIKEIPASPDVTHDSIQIRSTDQNGTDQEYVFWAAKNSKHMTAAVWFRAMLNPEVFGSEENVNSKAGILYRYTGDVNPYIYTFQGNTPEVQLAFAMNSPPRDINDMIVFYDILASVRIIRP